MVATPEGEVLFDLSGGAFGRGAWSHPTEACLRRAAKVMRQGSEKGGPSLAKASETDGLSQLLEKLDEAANRRAKGLVTAAFRAGYLALGSDASKEEFLASRARLVIIATDARAAKKELWIETAVSTGLVVGWSSKAELGALVGRDELAILVITDEGLANSLKSVLALRTPVTSRLAGASLAVARSMVETEAAGSHGLEDSEDG
jgi:ribosomal protein L7Ae-like RNA K-turn-binding protein